MQTNRKYEAYIFCSGQSFWAAAHGSREEGKTGQKRRRTRHSIPGLPFTGFHQGITVSKLCLRFWGFLDCLQFQSSATGLEGSKERDNTEDDKRVCPFWSGN